MRKLRGRLSIQAFIAIAVILLATGFAGSAPAPSEQAQATEPQVPSTEESSSVSNNAGGNATLFSPSSVSLTGIGDSATITVDTEQLGATASGHQINVQHSSAFTVTSPTCTGIFSGASEISPSSTDGGTIFGCFFTQGSVSGSTGSVATFTLTRVGAGNETITFGIDTQDGGDKPAGEGSKFSDADGTMAPSGQSSLGTLSSLSVTGFPVPDAGVGPSLSLASPNGEESWQIGSRQTVAWSSGGLGGAVRIEVSRDGGESWIAIVRRTPNDGVFTWRVSGPATEEARIRVTSNADPSRIDASETDFTIATEEGEVPEEIPSAQQTLAVNSPEGGETWEVGSRQAVAWSSGGFGGAVRIEVSRDGGESWIAIVGRTPNDGVFTWRVSGPTTEEARIRVTSNADPSRIDTSDADFAIVAQEGQEDQEASPETETLALTSPNGGESWQIGSRQMITWSSGGLGGAVRIEVSRDGGESWIAIVRRTPNDGVFTWRVSGPATEEARIRVTSNADPSRIDASDADFTIEVP